MSIMSSSSSTGIATNNNSSSQQQHQQQKHLIHDEQDDIFFEDDPSFGIDSQADPSCSKDAVCKQWPQFPSVELPKQTKQKLVGSIKNYLSDEELAKVVAGEEKQQK